MKWNMGWMHDTLGYFKENPIYRRHHQDKLTFVMMYAYSENFILPLSHDEVVHLKRSLLGRMPGDRWQQLANLRLLYTYMWMLPGKKLLFMGGEFAQPWEWDFRHALPWFLTDAPRARRHPATHRRPQRAVRARARPASLRVRTAAASHGSIATTADNSTLSFVRRAGEQIAVVVLNFTPVPRPGYRLGVPRAGSYRVALNSDSAHYGGANLGNLVVGSQASPCHGQAWSVLLDLPPLGALVLLPA